MSAIDLELSSHHDVEAYKKEYAKNGVVRVENLFPVPLADSIYKTLATQTPWHLVHSDAKGKHKYYRPEVWEKLPAKDKHGIINTALAQARNGFAYIYLCYPMIRAYLEKKDPNWPLHVMTEFLNSPEMLEFTKGITDEPSVIKLDAQATLYSQGHFLNLHDDTGDGAERRAAYVMGFTKNWSTNWGGHLLFTNGKDIGNGFAPSFNTLTLFKVPRDHIVTQVANFAGAGRYSITGWLRDDPK